MSKPSAGKVKGVPSYGWVVAAAGGIAILVAGNFQYAFGVFLKPLVNQFGWSRAAISGSVATRGLLSGVLSPFAGNLSDKHGPRKFIFAGVMLVGTGYLLASRISELWQLYLYLGILVGAGMALFYIPFVGTVTKWFGGRAALAIGVLLSGFSAAQIILPPMATSFITKYGWDTCFTILGATALGIGIIAGSFCRNPPPGLPDAQMGSQAGSGVVGEEGIIPTTPSYTLSEALHTPTLWTMFMIYLNVAVCSQLIAIHIVAAAIDDGITPEAAALILTFGGITNTLGRLTIGFLSNRIGNKKALALCLAIQAPALFVLAGTHNLYIFYLISAAYTFAYAGVSPIMPTMSASLFGTKSVGSIFGVLNMGFTLGLSIGPLLGGFFYDFTGNYTIAFLFTAIATTVTFLLCLSMKPLREREMGS